MNLNDMTHRIKEELSESRYLHTLRVRDTALELSEIFQVDSKKAEVAALLHDYAKCMEKDYLKRVVEEQLPKSLLEFHHELWHGPVGAFLIQDEFGITDADIIAAVEYHTTGRVGMSTLEKLILVSDYIEPARDFPLLEEVRIVARKDLTKAAFLAVRNTISYLLKNNVSVYPLSFHAYNDLQRQVYGGV